MYAERRRLMKCSYGEGVEMKIGDTPIDPCEYVTVERHENVTVDVIKCVKCGHTEVLWFKQDNTTSEYFGENGEDYE